MMGKVVSELSPLVSQVTEAVKEIRSTCSVDNSIIPALLPALFFGGKKWNQI